MGYFFIVAAFAGIVDISRQISNYQLRQYLKKNHADVYQTNLDFKNDVYAFFNLILSDKYFNAFEFNDDQLRKLRTKSKRLTISSIVALFALIVYFILRITIMPL